MQRTNQFYIDGQWVDPAAGARSFELVDPSTEQPFASVPLGGAADVDRAAALHEQLVPAALVEGQRDDNAVFPHEVLEFLHVLGLAGRAYRLIWRVLVLNLPCTA